MKCKICGNDEFIGHQVSRADIKVDEDGEFLENLEGGLSLHIYDYGDPYGPFTCTRCGAVYDELKDGAEVIEEPSPDWEDRVRQKEQKKEEILKDLLSPEKVFRWLAEHDNTEDMFCIFGEMDLEGVLKSYNTQDVIQKVSNYLNKKEVVSHDNKTVRKSIAAVDECKTLLILCDCEDKNLDLVNAAIDAAVEYCNTDEGRKIYAEDDCFTWSNFAHGIPDEICKKHGFKIVQSIESDYDQYLNDSLVVDGDIREKK